MRAKKKMTKQEKESFTISDLKQKYTEHHCEILMFLTWKWNPN